MSDIKKLFTPLSEKNVKALKIGDQVLLSGKIYTARDAAHKELIKLIKEGKEPPFDINGAIIYYVGPAPNKPDMPIGSAGPTTSGRMDAYSPALMKLGLKAMIGKGNRLQEVVDAMKKYKCVYLGATGGVGALLAKAVKQSKIIAYPELGPEAIRKLVVKDFPVIVVNDTYGNDLYKEGIKKFKRG
jgi:fumarate hydratase subunit beta